MIWRGFTGSSWCPRLSTKDRCWTPVCPLLSSASRACWLSLCVPAYHSPGGWRHCPSSIREETAPSRTQSWHCSPEVFQREKMRITEAQWHGMIHFGFCWSVRTGITNQESKFWVTLAVKTVRESKVSMDLEPSGMSEWRRQIIETYCPRFRESPTYIILFPLNDSNISVALNLHKKFAARNIRVP